jgi:hypothetical protein
MLQRLLGEEMQSNHVVLLQNRIAYFFKELDLSVKQVNIQLLDGFGHTLGVFLNVHPSFPNTKTSKHGVNEILQKHKDVEVFRPNRGVFGVLEDSVSKFDFESELVINF